MGCAASKPKEPAEVQPSSAPIAITQEPSAPNFKTPSIIEGTAGIGTGSIQIEVHPQKKIGATNSNIIEGTYTLLSSISIPYIHNILYIHYTHYTHYIPYIHYIHYIHYIPYIPYTHYTHNTHFRSTGLRCNTKIIKT